MKFLLSAAVAIAALASIQPAAANAKCQPTACYEEYVGPLNCKPGEPCAAIAILATICPWTCGHPVPAGCAERCKPCPAGKVCPEVCICENVCPKK